MIRAALVLVLVAGSIAVVDAPRASAGARGAATVSATATAKPGGRVIVSISAVACAGKSVRVHERYVASSGKTRVRVLKAATVGANGRKTVPAHIPLGAAKSAIAAPVYWTATSTAPACAAALTAAAASTAVAASHSASVDLVRRKGKDKLTVHGCTGGVAQAYLMSRSLDMAPIKGLRAKRGTVSYRFTPPRSTRALYIDCVQANVPGYNSGGIPVTHTVHLQPARFAAHVTAHLAGRTQTAAQSKALAVAAREKCAPIGVGYAFPQTCGTNSGASLIDSIRTSPQLHALEANMKFHRDYAAKLVHTEDLLREHPVPAPAIRGAKVSHRAGASTTVSFHQKAVDVDGTATVSGASYTDTSGATSAGVGLDVDLSASIGQQIDKRWHASLKVKFDVNAHSVICSETDGDVPYAVDANLDITLTITAPILHLTYTGRVSGHASVTMTAGVTDKAVYRSLRVHGAAEGDTEEKFLIFHGKRHSQANIDQTASTLAPEGGNFSELALGMVVDLPSKTINIHTYNPGGAVEADWATLVLFAAVVGTAITGQSAAVSAYEAFNTKADCVHLSVSGDTDVAVGSSTDLELAVTLKAGGSIRVPAQLSVGDGTLDPDQVTFTGGAKEKVTYAAPAATSATQTALHATGLSKRGRLDGQQEITIESTVGTVTLSVTAAVSDSDNCTTHRNGGCDSLTVVPFADVDHYTRSFSSRLSMSASLPAGDWTTPLRGTGTVTETSVQESGSGTWTNATGEISCAQGQCECTDSGSWSEAGSAGSSGTAGVQFLYPTRNAKGKITDLNLALGADTNETVTANYTVTSAVSYPTTPNCTTGTYSDPYGSGQGGEDFNLALENSVTGWTMNPNWNPKTGGDIARKTVTLGAQLSDLGGDDSGPVDVTATFVVRTVPPKK